jgi:hypothetical protein
MSFIEIQSTKANVSNVQAVKSIFDSYWYDFDFQIETHDSAGNGCLTLSGIDSWPEAMHLEDLPDDEEYPDEDDWDDALQDLLMEKGNEGFVAMLRKLAPYLETPLTVVWYSIDAYDFHGAGRWTVWPGSPDVQVQKVDPLPWSSRSTTTTNQKEQH